MNRVAHPRTGRSIVTWLTALLTRTGTRTMVNRCMYVDLDKCCQNSVSMLYFNLMPRSSAGSRHWPVLCLSEPPQLFVVFDQAPYYSRGMPQHQHGPLHPGCIRERLDL